jgi:hypothetical protein
MCNKNLISRFHPGSIFKLSFFVALFYLICLGPGSTQGFAAQVTLAWDANADPAVAGYKLYYGYAPGSYGTPVNVGKVTRYTLTGIQEGKNCYFAVTAYDTNGNESAFSEELECFTLVPAPVVNATIDPSSAIVVSRGMNQTFTIRPNTGYSVKDVLVDGGSIGAVYQYTFANVTNCHTIAVSFISGIIITASSSPGGKITPSGSVTVSQGSNVTFSIAPNPNYLIRDVQVDGVSIGKVNTYSFPSVTSGHTISAIFGSVFLEYPDKNIYSINASAGINGTISPSGNVSVLQGGSQFISIIPNAGYQVQDVVVDGVSVGAVTSYTFSNVTASHTISATFAPIHYQSGPLTSFNGDDKPDILWRNTSTGQNAVLYMNGVTVTGVYFLPTVADPNWTIGGVGDFNGDDKPDILWRNASSGQNAVWYMNGVTVTGVYFLPTLADPNWTIVGVDDFNGDGDPDILWRNTSTGQNAVVYMNGVTVTGVYFLPTIADPNWTIVGVGDFNGDSDPDILWRNASTGQNAVLYMNGVTVTGVDFLPPVADPNWTIVGVGDFNGDSDPDILWRNTSTGQNAVLYMNGVTVTGADFLPTVGDPNWNIY